MNESRVQLSRVSRRVLLVAHIASAGTWIGIDVVVAVLVLTGRFSGDDQLRSLAYRALAAFVVWPTLVSGLLCLATGVILALGTKWGLLRYWWVAAKLALNVVLCTLIIVALQPAMPEVDAYGRELLTGMPDPARMTDMFYPPAVSLTALTLATILAVFKPWGRIGQVRAERG